MRLDLAASAGALFAAVFNPDITVPYVGVPFNVIVACAAGAYSSFSFGDKVEPRSRMYQLFFTCVFMGAAFTAVVNAALGYYFDHLEMTQGLQAGIGAIVSCVTRFWLVWIVDTIRTGRWLAWIPFVRKSGE